MVIHKKIAWSYPYLFIPYGRFGKKNEIDDKSAMRIDIRDGSGLKLIDHPEKHHTCPDREKYPIVDIVNGDIYSVFLDDEQISVANIEGESIAARPIPFATRYMCFDRKQEANLAYTSKYDLNNEINLNLIYNNGYFYLIKRLRKADKKQRPQCVILVFDKELNYQFAFYPHHHVLASASTAYKEGVLIFSDKLNEAYYYAFKKEKP